MKNQTLSELLYFFIQSRIGIKVTAHPGSSKSDELVQSLLANENTHFTVVEPALELTLSKHAGNPILGEVATEEQLNNGIKVGTIASMF
ncbi:hypothetical protein ACTHQ2_23635, partial [Bacillus subtilis]|uniref:hypothetical protein n=1 Tax=Bacillus subtilis TaxID=1423 RepID=UPI003F7C28D8